LALNQQKQITRSKILYLRKSLTLLEVQHYSHLVFKNFTILFYQLQSCNLITPSTIFSLYFSCNNEVLTQEISQFLMAKKLKICYPKIVAKNLPLIFYNFNPHFATQKSKIHQNILEIDDKKSQQVIPNIIIAPLVAFDKNFNRLGMGGGFFDRTIANLTNIATKPLFIGLAFHFQQAEFSSNIYDEKLDFIITNHKIWQN